MNELVIKIIESALEEILQAAYVGVGNDAKRTVLVIDSYIAQQRAMGVADEIIIANLNDDLKTDRLGLFREFKNALRNRTTGLVHQAASVGMAGVYESKGKPKELYRWQAISNGNDEHSCQDCVERHDQEDTLEGWTIVGLPASGFSRCGTRCRCMIIPTGIKSKPLKLVRNEFNRVIGIE